MKVLWFAFVVVVVVAAVVTNLDEARDLLQQFLKRPLIIQILIGFVVWLITLMIVGYLISATLFEREKGGEAEGWGLIAFFILLPPAWPIAVIMLLVILIGNSRDRSKGRRR